MNAAYFIDSPSDFVVTIDGVSYNMSISSLCSTYPELFEVVNNEDEIPVLCMWDVAETVGAGDFLNSSNEPYGVFAEIFAGGIPPKRPW